MPLVVFLRGVNVGGHRRFRPAAVAQELHALDVVNIGAAGTFVVRGAATEAHVRAALRKRLPFETDMMICRGDRFVRFVASEPFRAEVIDARTVAFVSVLAARRAPSSPLPCCFPAEGPWGLKILGQHDRFVFGVYRREMRAVSYLSQIDKLFGVRATTRNWSTMLTIARVLEQRGRS
jgi:uncharacterized protein (DUF1697 family)